MPTDPEDAEELRVAIGVAGCAFVVLLLIGTWVGIIWGILRLFRG